MGVLLIVSCANNPKNQQYQTKLDSLIHENDSLKRELIGKSGNTDSLPPIVNAEEIPQVIENHKNTKRAGQHPISLQWISWDKPGTATIAPLDSGWYSIKGLQRNKEGDYLSIEGKLKRVSEKQLEFDGTIITQVKHNNRGEPCIKKGKQTFYGKGTRTYYRLQNMENCEGGMLVDYVDIYPGNSSI